MCLQFCSSPGLQILEAGLILAFRAAIIRVSLFACLHPRSRVHAMLPYGPPPSLLHLPGLEVWA